MAFFWVKIFLFCSLFEPLPGPFHARWTRPCFLMSLDRLGMLFWSVSFMRMCSSVRGQSGLEPGGVFFFFCVFLFVSSLFFFFLVFPMGSFPRQTSRCRRLFFCVAFPICSLSFPRPWAFWLITPHDSAGSSTQRFLWLISPGFLPYLLISVPARARCLLEAGPSLSLATGTRSPSPPFGIDMVLWLQQP